MADFFNTGGGRAAAAAGAGAAVGNRAAQAGDRAGQIANRAQGAAGERAAIADRAANRAGEGALAGNRQARVENRGDLRSNLADGRGDRRTERQQQLGDRADSIRDELGDRFDENHLFDDFWRDHPNAYINFRQNPVFWTWATFATASAFMPWNWGTGYYYDYGSGGDGSSSADSGTVYTDESTYSSQEYCEQAEQLANSAPEEPPADAEWLPLGVFAMTADDGSNALPNQFLQLAVSKEGIVAGTYQNKTTGQVESVDGMVDKESQRAAWTITGKNTPIMETGLQNLTMNETRALLHFADGTTQRWLLVRVEKPQDQATAQPAASQPAQ